jgi:hypothetical protein
MGDPYKEAQDLLEKLDVLSRISPCLDTDEEYGLTMAILMSIIADYVAKLRPVLTEMARGGAA